MNQDIALHLVEGLLLLGLGGLIRSWWKRYDEADTRNQQANTEMRIAVEKAATETREAVRDIATRVVTHGTTLAVHEREISAIRSDLDRLRALHDAVIEKLQNLEREYWRKPPPAVP